MENLVLRRGTNAAINFNNMTDEQLQEWRTAFLTEAQRENYVNHNLEIVRHYRTEAISRAPSLDIERNAIDAAIARHGLCVSANSGGDASAACTEPAAGQDEIQPPPVRRPRMEQPQQPGQRNDDAPSVSGAAASGSYGHYVALAHIFSDTFTGRAEPNAVAAIGNGVGNSNSNSNSNNNNNSNSNNNNEPEDSEINDVAIKKTIDSLGLRRT